MLENSLSKKFRGKECKKKTSKSKRAKNDQSVFLQIKKTHDLLSGLLQKQTLQQACFLAGVNEEVTHVRHIHETAQDSCSSMEGVTFLRCPLNNDTIISFGSRRTERAHNYIMKEAGDSGTSGENLKLRLFCNQSPEEKKKDDLLKIWVPCFRKTCQKQSN